MMSSRVMSVPLSLATTSLGSAALPSPARRGRPAVVGWCCPGPGDASAEGEKSAGVKAWRKI